MYIVIKDRLLGRRCFFLSIVLFLSAVIFIPLLTTVCCQAGQEISSEQSSLSLLHNSLNALPLSFEVRSEEKDIENEFLSRGPGYQLFLSPDKAVFRLPAERLQENTLQRKDSAQLDTVLLMQIVNANPKAIVQKLEPLPGKVNYFTGNNPSLWRTNIPTHARLRYNEIYPGIDLEYYGHQGELEYDFVVSPGTDPSQIRLAFEGVEKLEIAKNGDLLLHTSHGILRQKAPYSYQEKAGKRQVVPSHFVYYDNPVNNTFPDQKHIGFQLAAYDTSQPLVIDPALSYSSYFGGTYFDYAYGMTTDSIGNIYLTGPTSSSVFPLLNPFQATRQGGASGFVSKISADGSTLIYSTYLGGTGYDSPKDIAVDSSGNTYITGQTASTNFPVTTGVVQENYGGGSYDVFVAKLSATGDVLEYSSYLGGTALEYGEGIAVDSTGSAFVTGYTQSSDFPTANALYPDFTGQNYDSFVVQLNVSATAFIYSTFLPDSQAYDIAIDNSGNSYVTGRAWADFPVTAGAYAESGVSSGVFISKINTGGSSLIYSTLFGGGNSSTSYGIALDSLNRAYITGKTHGDNFPLVGAYQNLYNDNFDAFLSLLNADGSNLVYSSYLGGSQEDIGYAVTVDSLGAVFITGSTQSTDFPLKQPFLQGSAFGGGTTDAFISRFDLSQTGEASLGYSVFMGGSADDSGQAISCPFQGICYVGGYTRSGNFPLLNPLQDTITPNYTIGYFANAFIAIIADDQEYANLSLTIDDLPDPVEIGSDYTYQVHISNSGSETATGVVLTNTLPSEVSFVSTTATQGTPVYGSGIVTLDIGTINYSETVTLTITVTAPGTDTALTNTASVTSTSADSNLTDNTLTEETLVRSQYYTFNFYNRNYPNANDPSCGTVTSTPSGLDCDSDCSADFLVDTVLRLTASTPENCELIRWTGGDGYEICGNSANDCFATVSSGAWAKAEFRWIDSDLLLTSEDEPDISLISGNIDYHLTINHIGVHRAQNLVLVDTLPLEVVYVTSNTSSGSCSYDSIAHQVTCNINYLNAGNQVDITITVTAPSVPGTITNQAVVSNTTHDRDLSNNAITEITTITDQQQTLTVTKTGDGSGSVTSQPAAIDCGGDCTELLPQGTIVHLVPNPERGFFFTGWSGDDCSGMEDCVVLLDSDKTVTADFTATPPATIALPKTGQTTCFDDTGIVIDCTDTGQDGEIQSGMIWPDPRFELTYCDITGPCIDQSTDCDADSSTDIITDLLTGLIWSRSSDLSSGTVTWQQALDTVSNLNVTTGLGGESDWRVPNINELASLLLHQKHGYQVNSWLSSQGFIISHYSSIWSSTTYFSESYGGSRAYSLGLQVTELAAYIKTDFNRVWAVRGTSNGSSQVWKTKQMLCYDTIGETIDCAETGQDGDIQAGVDWPHPRFSVIYSDGNGQCADQSVDCDSDESTDMVRDNLTGLILARNAHVMGSGGNMQAVRDSLVTINNGSSIGGHTDWRLPNIVELLSLVDFTQENPSIINDHPFVNLQPYSGYWSSNSADLTSCSSGNCANLACCLFNFNGRIAFGDKISRNYYLWPVREDTGSADLRVSISDSSDPVQINGSLTYAINILNNGPGDATDVSLENTLPPEVSFVSATSSQGTCSHTAGDVDCTMDDIASNATSIVNIEVSVGTALVTLENSATVTTSKNDPNSANNTAVETTQISDTEYTLTVNKGGTGGGTVTSNPTGIDCGSTCLEMYFETTPITLTAVADGTSLFMGWDGCDQVTGNECTVAMNNDQTVTAFFDTETTANYYVSSTGDDSNSGLGWSRPFKTIEKALSIAESGEEIWVKAGTYQPPIVSELSNTSYFSLYKKVNLYGGFAGSETVRNQRDWESNSTIVNAQRSGYSTHGFYINTGSDSGPGVRARIDGFVIRDGWALGSYYPLDAGGGVIVYSGAPLIANCDIKFNYAVSGGGIAAGYGTTITNCKIRYNNAQNYGGGVQGNSGVQVINSTVYSNYSTYSGAGIAFWNGGSIDSSTITANWTSSSSGVAGFHGYSSGTTTITNSIIWGNTKGGNPSEISTSSSGGATANVTYSNIRGGYSGTGNIDNDPEFLDSSGGDLKVQPYAMTIDTGNTAALPGDSADLDGDGNTSEQLPWDIDKNSRVVSTVDMGAYEYIPGLYTEYTLSVTVAPSGAATVTGPGVNCGSSCTTDYYANSQLTLTAAPQSPYRFAYWEGCSSSNWDQCSVTMDAAKAVTSHLVNETADDDSDTMLDWWEWFYFHTLNRDGNGDYDGDGLIDKDEFALNTYPNNSDSDGDGMPDGWEVGYTLLPLVDDADLDADDDDLTNLEEYEYGTNPLLADSDSDGMPDAWEVSVGLNPTVNDASGDADGDGVSNLDEYLNGTNPTPLCGDVSDDTVIDLTDLILVLQVLTGTSTNSYFNGDCNSDGKIGLNEGLFILQRVAND